MNADHAHESDLERRKAECRGSIRKKLSGFASRREAVSEAIVDSFVGSEYWIPDSVVMAYLALPGEVDLDGLWEREPRPTLGVPRIEIGDPHMAVCAIGQPPADTEPGPMGVRTPRDGAPEIEPDSIRAVLVPGLGFDESGNRLGRGGGYYDRFLAAVGRLAPDVAFIGVCWSEQVAQTVPAGPLDVSVHMLLTEHGLRRCRA